MTSVLLPEQEQNGRGDGDRIEQGTAIREAHVQELERAREDEPGRQADGAEAARLHELRASRVRAGERLPLRIDNCDLAVVATEVYEELVAAFGDRFVLKANDRVVGFWSADELRRAL